ncbi:MAG: FkbM family methyltransferase [Pirellulales bacterium]
MASVEAVNRQKACRHGQMLYNVHDTVVGRSLDLYGEYCESEIELFRQVIEPDSIVVEVGANIGAHTVFLARQVMPSGMVVAFEPQRILFQTLCANLALNNILNAFCFQQAVGAQRGSIVVPTLDFTRENNFGSLALGSYQSGESVPMIRLDDLNLPACHFLKVDVEGMEKEVIEGGTSLIARCRPVMYVENENPDKSDALVRLIDSLSYRMYWHRPFYFSPNNFFGNLHNVFPNTIAFNIVCIHQSVTQELTGLEPIAVGPDRQVAS